jgi:hypothetical protein
MYTVWFLAVAILPPRAARWLAEQLLAPQASVAGVQALLASLRKARLRPIHGAATGGQPLL